MADGRPTSIPRALHVGTLALIATAVAHVVSGATPEPVAPSADRGRALAERLCSGCHLTGTGTPSTAVVGIPTFRGIADRPGLSARAIENVLVAPHPPMPDARLTMTETRDLIAYIDSLRTDRTRPPLLPTVPPPRPKAPTPS